MGNYERFLGVELPPENYMTSGMVYRSVIERERALGYGGRCVEAVPHVVQEILDKLEASVQKTNAEVTVVEIGGTIGDYQNSLFIEAARILKLRKTREVLFVLVSYLPVPSKIGEMKTRPTQHAIRTLNSYGVQPDIVIARSHIPLDKKRKEKIAVASNVPMDNIISAPDIDSIYEVPINFEKDGLSTIILKHFGMRPKQTDLVEWRKVVEKIKNPNGELQIAMVGKYFKTGDFVLSDVYLSVIESLKFAGAFLGKRVNLTWVDSALYEENSSKLQGLDFYDGVVVPGGFGKRGVEGIIAAIRYTREHKIPYFGLCYGMQLATVEYARHKAGLSNANTTEIDPKTAYPVIDILPGSEQINRVMF
jgi:CTP synthase